MKDQYKMELVLNGENIAADGYDLDEYKAFTDRIFNGCKLEKRADGCYYSTAADPEKDNVLFGAVYMSLRNSEYFKLDYVSQWIWYEKDEYDGQYYTEDVKATILERAAKKSR